MTRDNTETVNSLAEAANAQVKAAQETCKKAFDAAKQAAEAAAEALKIDPPGDSPLVKEVAERAKTIPNGDDAGVVADFIEQMKQIQDAANALKASAG